VPCAAFTCVHVRAHACACMCVRMDVCVRAYLRVDECLSLDINCFIVHCEKTLVRSSCLNR
jgi:hypothetical protein